MSRTTIKILLIVAILLIVRMTSACICFPPFLGTGVACCMPPGYALVQTQPDDDEQKKKEQEEKKTIPMRGEQ